jgi:hypothetical protein
VRKFTLWQKKRIKNRLDLFFRIDKSNEIELLRQARFVLSKAFDFRHPKLRAISFPTSPFRNPFIIGNCFSMFASFSPKMLLNLLAAAVNVIDAGLSFPDKSVEAVFVIFPGFVFGLLFIGRSERELELMTIKHMAFRFVGYPVILCHLWVLPIWNPIS